jgi:hypothetical protein
MPRVSVIIPTRDRAALVVEAIGSVLAQTYRDFEIVVCDDGSTDDTAARVAAFGPPVRYLRLDPTGRPGPTRNRGTDAARGDLVAFLDDDDLWEPEKLARQVDRIDRDPEVDVVYTDRCVVSADGTRSGPVSSPDPDAGGRLLDEALGGRFPHNCTLLFRREALARAGGFDEVAVAGGDLGFWLRIGRVLRAARVPEPLTLVRRRTGSLSQRSPTVTFGTVISALERELDARDLHAVQRLRCRRTLALHYAQLAGVLLEARDRAGARRAAARGVARFPASRNAWRAAARVWLAGA